MKKLVILFLAILTITLTNAQMVRPVVLIIGKAANERNMEPADARIIYETLPDGTEAGIARTNPLSGAYKIILPYGKKYGYYALAEGYYSVTKFLDVTDLTEYKEIEDQNLFLAPIESDQVIRLNNIFFQEKSATLTEESYPELIRFVEFLKTNKKVSIQISGHTNILNDSIACMELSQKRAQSIADFIVSKKINIKRVTVKGFGSSQPIGFTNSKEGKLLNDRIEFIIKALK